MNYGQANQVTAQPPETAAVSDAFNRVGRAIEDCAIATRNLEDRINAILARPNEETASRGVEPITGVPMADQIMSQALMLEELNRHLNTLFKRVQL